MRYPRLEPRDDRCAKKLAKRTLTWLANAHARLDVAVAQAYGFPVDLTDEQILERLLALNQQSATESALKGKTKSVTRTSRAKTTDELI